MASSSKCLIHCHKCEKKTKHKDSKIVQSNNGVFRKAANI